MDENDEETLPLNVRAAQYWIAEGRMLCANCGAVTGVVALVLEAGHDFLGPDEDSDEEDDAYWMNHCEHCDAPVDEEEVHEGLDGPFGEMPYGGPDTIRLYAVEGKHPSGYRD